MRVLLIVSTPYQFMVASQIIHRFYRDAEIDLILTDQMNHAEEIYETCRDMSCWRQVFFLCERRLNRLPARQIMEGIFLSNLLPRRNLERFVKLEGSYDLFLFANLSLLNQYIIKLLKRRNRGGESHAV